MNDEIKEILDELKEYASGGMSGLYPAEQQVQHLLDYITNLQENNNNMQEEMARVWEENERLKIILDEMGVNFNQVLDYKSRCEKAVEYNNQIIKDTKDFYRPTTDIIYSGDALIEIATNNINILQNGSEEK